VPIITLEVIYKYDQSSLAEWVCLSRMCEWKMQFYSHKELLPMQQLSSSNQCDLGNDFPFDKPALGQMVPGYL
jgi:hypothetical protein